MTKHELVKLYYRIGEVSQIVGVQPHVLRYWESEFRSIRPQKSNKGQRVYSRRDVEKLLAVKDLLKNQGFTIAGARKQLGSKRGDAPHAEQAEVAARVSSSPSPLPSARAPADARPAKSLRRALVQLRSEICAMLAELRAGDGRPDS